MCLVFDIIKCPIYEYLYDFNFDLPWSWSCERTVQIVLVFKIQSITYTFYLLVWIFYFLFFDEKFRIFWWICLANIKTIFQKKKYKRKKSYRRARSLMLEDKWLISYWLWSRYQISIVKFQNDSFACNRCIADTNWSIVSMLEVFWLTDSHHISQSSRIVSGSFSIR